MRPQDDYQNPWQQDPAHPVAATPGASQLPGATADPWATAQASAGPAPQTPAPAPPSATPGGAPGPSSYLADAGMPPGGAPAAAGGGEVPATAYQAATNYGALLNGVKTAADPTAQASARDALARQVQGDLEADGHKIAWKGDTLMVDGRPYELGGSAGGWGATTQQQEDTGGGGDEPRSTTQPAGPPVTQPGTTPAPGAPGATAPAAGSTPDYQQGNISLRGADVARVNAMMAKYGVDPSEAPYWYKTVAENGGSVDAVGEAWLDDAIMRADSAEGVRNGTVARRAPSGGPGGGWGATTNTYGPIDTNYGGFDPNTFGSPMDLGINPLDESGGDLPGFEELYRRYSADDPAEGALRTRIMDLLQHPESLSEKDIATLKAKSADEATAAGEAQDADLQHFGANANLGNSPWLAGQRATSAWNRREATITGNRNVDIAAAQTRAADQRSAAQLGQAYTQYRTAKGQQALNGAVSGALGKLGAQRDAHSINVAMAEAARQLGLSRDQLAVLYAKNNMDYDLDLKKLNEQSDEFRQTLMQRIAEWHDDQNRFRSTYGLDVQRLQRDQNNDAWNHANATYNPGG